MCCLAANLQRNAESAKLCVPETLIFGVCFCLSGGRLPQAATLPGFTSIRLRLDKMSCHGRESIVPHTCNDSVTAVRRSCHSRGTTNHAEVNDYIQGVGRNIARIGSRSQGRRRDFAARHGPAIEALRRNAKARRTDVQRVDAKRNQRGFRLAGSILFSMVDDTLYPTHVRN